MKNALTKSVGEVMHMSRKEVVLLVLLLPLALPLAVPVQAQDVQDMDLQKMIEEYAQVMKNFTPPELYTPYVQDVFSKLDLNNDGSLDLIEMQAAYKGIKSVFKYRYDDESEPNPAPNTLVGDGRPGPEYYQTPEETLREWAGDCEDFAILFASLLNYYGYPAFVGYIDCNGDGELDHATCLLYTPNATVDVILDLGISDVVDVFETTPAEIAEKAHYEGFNNEIYRDWVLIPIDGTYSMHFGYVSGSESPETGYFLLDFYTVKDFLKRNPGAATTPTPTTPAEPTPTPKSSTLCVVVAAAVIIAFLLRKKM